MPKPPRTPDTATVRMSRFEVDWFTTSIRTLLVWGALLLTVAAIAAYGYWQRYYGPEAPATRAQQAVFKAQDLLIRARDVERSDYFKDAVERAEAALGEAKAALTEKRFTEAEARALDSQRASREVLDTIAEKQKKGPTAKFVKVMGTVEVKKRDESRWVTALPQMALDPGDLVRTKAESSAQLIFFDGVNMVLSPSSLIEVQLRGVTRDGLNRNPNVHVTVGTVDLSTPKFNVAGTTPSLSTENVEATLRNDTDIRVARIDERKTTRLLVSGSGGAELLSSRGEKTDIGPREGADVAGAGDQATTVKRKLPRTPLLVLPPDLRLFLDPPTDGVQLRWQQLSEAASYHVQVADTSLWAKTLVDRSDIRGEPILTIKGPPPGDYYWRVAAADAAGNESPWSQHRKFTIPKPGDKGPESEDHTPPKLTVLKNMVFENIVIITGETEPGATVTVNDERVDVEENGSFTHFTVLYNDGINDMHVAARDQAGNMMRRNFKVDVAVF